MRATPGVSPDRRFGLSGRATLLILVIVCTSFVACSSYVYIAQSSALRANLKTTMWNLSAASARGVRNWLGGKLQLTQIVAQQISVVGIGPQVDDVLGLQAARETFVSTYVGGLDGFYREVPAMKIPPGYDPRERPWYQSAMAAGGPILTEPYLSVGENEGEGELTVTAASPVVDRAFKPIGVVGSDFDIAVLAKMIGEIDTGGKNYAYMVSGTGTVLIHPTAGLIGKPLSNLITGPPPTIGGEPSETHEGDRATVTVFARVPNLPKSLDWYIALSVDRAEAFAPVERLGRIMIASTLIALVAVGLAVSRLMSTTVARPLNRLVTELERMSQGEIDAEIVESRRWDEIGMVGRAVEGIRVLVAQKAAEQAEAKQSADEVAAADRRRAMIALADGFETAVGAIVGTVSSSAAALQVTAQTLTATATQAAVRSPSVAAAAEEAATNVRTVAAAAEQLGASVHEIAGQVESSSSLARAAVGEADQTGLQVQELAQAVSKIGDAVALIASIASQTNLLALNATIEAARAGEAGRGFAVVATEVKALASQTARVTEEISGLISRIQGSTGQAVQAINGIVLRIRDINDVAGAVAAAVEEQGAATQEIVRNVGQAASGTDEVTTNITGVAEAAERTGSAAHHVLNAANALTRQSAELDAEVARFLRTVRAA